MKALVGAFNKEKALAEHCESPVDSSLVMASHKVRSRSEERAQGHRSKQGVRCRVARCGPVSGGEPPGYRG